MNIIFLTIFSTRVIPKLPKNFNANKLYGLRKLWKFHGPEVNIYQVLCRNIYPHYIYVVYENNIKRYLDQWQNPSSIYYVIHNANIVN